MMVVIQAGDGDPELLVQALESLQALLPQTGYAIGEFSIADVAIVPFLIRLELLLENDLGGWPEGERKGRKILDVLKQPKLARIWDYWRKVEARPSVVAIWDKVRFG
jgi:glutathione S-transferase